jgi:hypothetical protein
MNEQQPSFVPVPIMPWMQQGHSSEETPPARIRVAMEFLNSLTMKTMRRPYGNNMTIDVIPGQKLTKAELNTQATAANLLNDYFTGKMQPAQWEEQQEQGCGTVLRCFACYPGPKPECALCHGAGLLLVYPTTSQEAVMNQMGGT